MFSNPQFSLVSLSLSLLSLSLSLSCLSLLSLSVRVRLFRSLWPVARTSFGACRVCCFRTRYGVWHKRQDYVSSTVHKYDFLCYNDRSGIDIHFLQYCITSIHIFWTVEQRHPWQVRLGKMTVVVVVIGLPTTSAKTCRRRCCCCRRDSSSGNNEKELQEQHEQE